MTGEQRPRGNRRSGRSRLGRRAADGVRPDDVLVSRRTARADAYAVGVVSARSDTTHVRYEEGIAAGRELARILGVDAWFTCDHLHFARLTR